MKYLLLLFSVAAFCLFPLVAFAQAGSAQFIFVIDDSTGDFDDPDRLAIFAAQGMLNMLDHDDEVTVLPLNSSEMPPLRRLSENRRSLEALIDLDGELASYSQRRASCGEAFGAVHEELQSSYRPGTQQVVVFLTRSRCQGAGIDADQFLSDLSSHEDGLFQFYLLQWPFERNPSPALTRMAGRSGGVHTRVDVENPIQLFEPFAQILSRVRGAESHLLYPGRSVLPAHSAARQVHLMAVAPDSERELSLTLTPLQDDQRLKDPGKPHSGRHQFGEGLPFRFATLSYEPTDSPVEVTVEGAGSMSRVEITRRAIVINEAVHFDYDRATVREDSLGLLDEIAQVVNDATRIRRIEIQGHTDHSGGEDYNKKLSQERAESVREYLIEQGVQADRLTARGYGFSEPIVALPPGGRETTAAAAQNRRVEFVILDQDEADESAGDGDWVVVAVPDYRLDVKMTVTAGRCGDSDQPASFVPDGGLACAIIELVNERGELVTYDLAGAGTTARLHHRNPRDRSRHVVTTRDGDDPRFKTQLRNLQRGDHILRPRITMAAQGQPDIQLSGSAQTVQASSRQVGADPGEVDLGDIRPGSEHYEAFTLEGNFPTTPGRLIVADREDLPKCMRFKLSGVAEGELQPLTSGQEYTIATNVAPNCGPSSFTKEIDTNLQIKFETDGDTQPVPILSIPLRAKLHQTLEVTESPVELTTTAGTGHDFIIELTSNHGQDLALQVLTPDDDHKSWPDKTHHLELMLLDERGRVVTDPDSGKVAREHTIIIPSTADEISGKLAFRVRSSGCCEGGVYQTQIAMVPTVEGAEPLLVDVEITVEEAGWWACWGPRILKAVQLLFILLLLAYLFNIYRNSYFLDRERLANSLTPMEWDEMQQTRPNTRAANQVNRMVRNQMGLRQRLVAWLRANPLIIGLPGREYNESVELALQPSIQANRSRVILLGERDHLATLRKNPRRAVGRIYATARGGMTFYTVPAEGERVGMFTIDTDFDEFSFEEEFTPSLEVLRRRTELRAIHTDGEPGDFAGWRVGR